MASVEQLLQDQRLWRGKDYPQKNHDGNNVSHSVSTGIPVLDRQLHWRGWPLHSSTELLCDHWGIGELSLLAPLLRHSSQQQGKIAWLNPPYIPYPPALAALGINPTQCLMLHSEDDAQWWAAEQCLNSCAFDVVLTWFNHQQSAVTAYRRLQAAATVGQCLHFHFRPSTTRQQASPARLRLYLHSQEGNLEVEVLKQPGGWAGQQCTVERSASLLFQQQSPQLWPAYTGEARPLVAPRLAPRQRIATERLGPWPAIDSSATVDRDNAVQPRGDH